MKPPDETVSNGLGLLRRELVRDLAPEIGASVHHARVRMATPFVVVTLIVLVVPLFGLLGQHG
jgi:hypothetical protein